MATHPKPRPFGAAYAAAGLGLAAVAYLAARQPPLPRAGRALATAAAAAALLFPVLDLRRRRRGAEELAASGATLAEVLENVRAAVFIKDAGGRLLVVNREYEKIFGRARAGLLGRTNADFMSPEAARALMEHDAEVLRRGEPVELEERVETADGPRTFLALKFPVRGPAGTAFLGGVATDISALKDREARLAELNQELAAARTLLQTVLDAVPASVYLIGLDGTLLFLNQECARTLGGTPESVRGRPIGDFFSARDAAAVLATNRAIHEGGRRVEVEEPVVSADGPRVYLSCKTPISLRPADPPTLCGVSTDITARKESERKLADANRELEAFTYSVSHDLRAPLRAIDGFARLLVQEHAAGLDEEGRRMLARVSANVERMGALIDDLLAFSRLGRQELRESAVDMGALARRAAADAAAGEPDRRVRLRVGAMPAAHGDAEMLSVVWTNLFSNAYKYTRPRAEAVIEAGGDEGPDALSYWIRDDGVGFDPRFAGKLFAVFQRLHGADEFEGTGVGLALVRRVVERHGGSVEAEGAPGRGAEFRFRLPRRRP